MGKVSSFIIRSLALVAFLGLGMVYTANATTVTLGGTTSACTTSTDACWQNITVTGYAGVTTNVTTGEEVQFFTTTGSTALNILVTCPSCSPAAGMPGTKANLASLYGQQVIAGGTTSAPMINTSLQFQDNNDDLVAVDSAGQNGPGSSMGGLNVFENFSITSAGLVTIQGASLELQFTLPTSSPTPEPSSLLMLGSGLMGLAGYGWRRKSKV